MLDPVVFEPYLVAALDAGDVACVRLCLPNASDDAVRRACDRLRPVVQARDIAFLLAGHPALAAETGCDGVHLGSDHPPYATARRLVGDRAVVGVSCGTSRHVAMEAAEAGADYVSFRGGLRDPSLVPNAEGPVGDPGSADTVLVDLVAWWQALMVVPAVASGDITPQNCHSLVSAGADFLAVLSAVWTNPAGPAAAVRAFNRAIAAAAPAGSD